MTVAPDTLCVNCGYALANIHAAGLCPECGTPVSRSLRTARLEDSSPAYLRILWWSLIVSVVSWLISIAGFVAEESAPEKYITIIVLASLFGELAGSFAAYLFASPDPARLLDASWERLRQRTRTIAVVDLVFQCISVSLRILMPGPVAVSFSTLTEVISQLTFILAFRLAANLATRAGRPRLAIRCRRLSWSLVIIGSGMLAMSLSELGGPLLIDIVGITFAIPMIVALLAMFYFMATSIPSLLTLLAAARRESLRKSGVTKA